MSISRRKVFYISGFDPRGPRHYYSLFTTEIKKYALLSNKTFDVSPRHRDSDEEVSWTIEHEDTHTDYTMLCWDDIVRKHWDKNPTRLFIHSVKAYISTFMNARWKTAFSLSRAPLITFGYPLLVLAILGLLIFSFAQYLFFFTDNIYVEIAGICGLFFAAYKAFSFVKTPWLLRLFILNNKMADGRVKEIEDRLDHFAAIIQDTADDNNYDEILLIGHSNGATFLAPIIERLIRKGLPLDKIHVISLGHCIPLTSLGNKHQTHYTDTLKNTASRRFLWLDFGAVADGTCYALIGPYKGVVDDDQVHTDIVLKSPRFHTAYNAKKYKQLKLNKYAFHFLYLTSPDILGGYCYFDMVTGSDSLRDYIKTLK